MSSKFGEWVKKTWNKFIGSFNAFIKEVFTDATKIIIAEMKDFAVDTISALAATDLTSEAKRLEAFKKIKDEAARRGKVMSDSVINLTIELAVTKLKNSIK